MKSFDRRAYRIFRNFLPPSRCEKLLSRIRHYQSKHPVQHVFRKNSERSLDYYVIDGHALEHWLPVFWRLYERMNLFLIRICRTQLFPLNDKRAALNINITEDGGEYRWHYDRNRVTALLYLNRVQGGEIEFYPNYRIRVTRDSTSRLQQSADRALQLGMIRKLFGKKIVSRPAPGKLIVMRGDRCLHSVRPVTGGGQRVNVVMAYDLPGHTFSNHAELDRYLYEERFHDSSDPNYR
jgi:hypothetical protein